MGKLKIATWNISCGIPAEWSLSNGIQKEKDYNKKASKIGRKTSEFIEKGFSKSLKYIMRYVESLEN